MYDIEKQIAELDLNKQTAARLIQRFPELRLFFEDEMVNELLEPEANFMSEVIELAHPVDPPTEEGTFPLHDSDFASPEVIQTELDLAESHKQAAAKGEKKGKREKLTVKQEEQRRVEYQKMRAIKRQRK